MAAAHRTGPRETPVTYPCPVRRVTVRWDGSDWKIVKQIRVPSMTLPAPDPLPAGEQSRGFWIETSDVKGGIYHREVMPDPLLGMEQFQEGGEITRMAHPPHDLTIELLVPEVPGVSEVHIVRNLPPPGKPGARSELRRTVLKLSGAPVEDVPRQDEGGHGEHRHPQ